MAQALSSRIRVDGVDGCTVAVHTEGIALMVLTPGTEMVATRTFSRR
jgi:hypothetical protein